MARVSALTYRETLWSDLFEGSRPSITCLEPAVLSLETALGLAPKPEAHPSSLELGPDLRRHVVWRMDGGFGCDDHLRWLLARNYHIMVKGFSGRRAYHLAQQVKRWDRYGDVWLGRATLPIDLGRRIACWVKRRPKAGQFEHSYYLTTLKLPSKGVAMNLYNQRGGAEIEQFRQDKQGLHLSARRKQRFLAQKALILLTDLAHNLLADFYHSALVSSRFADFGLKRIVRDVLAVEGCIQFENDQVRHIALLETHPYARTLLDCLVRYCSPG